MAKINVVKEALLLCRDAGITPFIWGHRGLGKSSIVYQLTAEHGWGFIDMRCSQLEASDIRGLPDRGEDGRTHYLPPADMPVGDMSAEQIRAELAKAIGLSGNSTADAIAKKLESADLELQRRYYQRLHELQPHFQQGILFLDEVNRAQDDVLQAVFQLVLDRRVGRYLLPPGWCVVAAGNFMDGYRVNGFDDPAFLNRFCHLILSGGEATLDEWVSYMASVHGANAAEVIDFACQNIKHLDGDIKGELGFSIQPSRRSWEMVVRVLGVAATAKYSEEARTEVIAGLVGRELAVSFARYTCPVKPKDLLRHGLSAAMTEKLKKLSRGQLIGLMWGMVTFCRNRLAEDAVANVCLDFASFLALNANDRDIVVAFCRALVVDDQNNKQQKVRAAMISNPRLADLVQKFKPNKSSKDFLDRLSERPELQQALAKVSWGSLE